MAIDIKEFEEIGQTRGGKTSPTFALGRQGYINVNNNYIEANKDFEEANSLIMKAKKEEDKIIILLKYFKNEDGTFKIGKLKKDDGKIIRKSFSIRGVFNQFNLSYKKFAQEGVVKLTPKKEIIGNDNYYVIEIPLM